MKPFYSQFFCIFLSTLFTPTLTARHNGTPQPGPSDMNQCRSHDGANMILPCRRKLPSSDDATRPLPRAMKPGWASRRIRLRSVSRRFRSLLSPCSGFVRIRELPCFKELGFTNNLPLQLSLGSSSLVVSSSRVSPDSSVKLPPIEPFYTITT